MIKSVNQIRLELAEIQSSHLQLNSFFWGDFLRAYKENRLNYPLMGAFYPTSTLLRNQTQLQLRIYIADKLYKDWSNLNDIESDTLQTCRDVFNIMNNSTRWQTIGRVQSCSVTKFINRGGDEVAGHEMTMNFLIRDRDGVCGLPLDGYDFDQITGALCSPVQIFENGLLVATIPSGGTYSYSKEDSTYSITDTDNNVLYTGSISSGGTLTQPISDSVVTLKDTALNVLNITNVLAEGVADITAPDATYLVEYVNGTDIQSGSIVSGGSVTVTVPNPIVCADTTIEVNGTIEGTVTAGSTVDVQLSDSGGVVTPTSVTQVGNDLQIVLPDAPIAVTRSTATLMKTGQTTSYRTGDDGDLEAGRATDFLTLDSAPLHNDGTATLNTTTARFTDTLGGSTYANDIVLDWSTWNGSTLLGFTRNFVTSSVNWNSSIDACLAYSVGSFVSGWRMPNVRELLVLKSIDLGLDYAPFINFTGGILLYTSTNDSTTCLMVSNVAGINFSSPQNKTTVTSRRAIACRTFSLSILNVLS